MDSKIFVTLVKSKSIDSELDINKMSVHIEGLLTEKEHVDLKVRNSLTEANIKSSDFIIFCGFDSQLLSELFKVLAFIESNLDKDAPQVFLYEEPGKSIYEYIDKILMSGIDYGRTFPKIHDRIMDCWSYRDIIRSIDIKIRKLGSTKSDTDCAVVLG